MTREEEIKIAAKKYSKCTTFLAEHDFTQGAKWADKNSQSPWINVKDDLPCNHKELLDIGSGETETLMVLVASEKEFPTQTWMELRNGYWKWHGCVTPSHWMIIPELPKE